MSAFVPPSLSADASRAALTARCGDDLPAGAWKSAAAAAGVSGADAFLCHLSRSVAGALERLAGSAEDARARLQSVREALAADVVTLSHCDELESAIEAAETTKRVVLEREHCAVDEALEKLRAARNAATEAAATLNDAELVAQLTELSARLDAADALLLALPTSVVEPPHVGLVIDEPALLAGAAVFGRDVAPRAITAADLTLEGAPSYVWPGCTLLPRLVFRDSRHASQSAEELEVSLGTTATASHVEASLQTEGAAPQPLRAEVSADVPGRCIVISIIVPATAPVGSLVCFGPLTVSGQPVAGLPGVLRVEPPCPADLSPEHAAWLQAQLPPGGSCSLGEWEEVYRATTHGFKARTFHERCDGRVRLLVLVRAQEGGWLFGGFTAVGFISGPLRYVSDPSAFLFSLTNSLGRPEKLESKRMGKDLVYNPSTSACFCGLYICDNADSEAGSETRTGGAYAASASTGAHPMALGRQEGWFAAEAVAWVV